MDSLLFFFKLQTIIPSANKTAALHLSGEMLIFLISTLIRIPYVGFEKDFKYENNIKI